MYVFDMFLGFNASLKTVEDKMTFLRGYRFNICFENASHPGPVWAPHHRSLPLERMLKGYCTEKILHAFAAGCVGHLRSKTERYLKQLAAIHSRSLYTGAIQMLDPYLPTWKSKFCHTSIFHVYHIRRSTDTRLAQQVIELQCLWRSWSSLGSLGS